MTQDLQTVFSDAQAVTGTAGTTVSSTDWIDFLAAQDNAGAHGPVVEFTVTTTFAGAGASVTFNICACEADGSNAVVLDTTGAIAITALTAPTAGVPTKGGTVLHLRMSPKAALPAISGSDPRQALRCQYVISGATITAGAVSAKLVPEAGVSNPDKVYPGSW